MNDISRMPAVTAAVRTPVGRVLGSLSTVRVDDLAAQVLRAVVDRVPDPRVVEEVACGIVNASGEAMGNPARFAVLLAGLPDSVSGYSVNRYCGSGLTALTTLAASIAMGAHRGGVAVGAESMSRSTWPLPIPVSGRGVGAAVARNAMWSGAGGPQNPVLERDGVMIEMAPAVQHTAMSMGITRAEMDVYAAESHRRAAAAVDAGRFDDEIVPVAGDGTVVTSDETIRRDTTIEGLASLVAYDADAPDMTAGNSSPVNDGASAIAVVDAEAASEHPGAVLARLVGYSTVGVPPRDFATAPVHAIARLLERHGLSTSDIDLVEINEAFAAQSIACIRALDLDADRVNVNGGALALGHALGNSGTRITTTLLHEMNRRDVEWGVAALCVGSGQGIAALFRRAS